MTEVTHTINNVNDISMAQSDISSLQETVGTDLPTILRSELWIRDISSYINNVNDISMAQSDISSLQETVGTALMVVSAGLQVRVFSHSLQIGGATADDSRPHQRADHDN